MALETGAVLMILQLRQSFLQAVCPYASEELKNQVVSGMGKMHSTRGGVLRRLQHLLQTGSVQGA